MNPLLLKLPRVMALAGYFGLVVGIYVWHMVLNRVDDHLVSLMLLLQLGPLMFPLRGLMAGRAYTHAWSIYLAIAYFVMGVWYAGADESFGFGLYVIASSLLFLGGCIFYTRYRSRADADSNGD